MAMWRRWRWPPGLAHAVSCSVGHGVGVGLAAAPRQDVAHVIGRMMKDFGVKGAVCALYSMRVSNKKKFSSRTCLDVGRVDAFFCFFF